MHTGKNTHKFLGVTFGDGTDSTTIFWFREFYEIKSIVAILSVESVACAHIFEFHSSTYVTCAELVNLSLDAAAYTVDLSDAFTCAASHILKVNTGSKRS